MNSKQEYNETLEFKLAMCGLIIIVGSPIIYLLIYSMYNVLTVCNDLLN